MNPTSDPVAYHNLLYDLNAAHQKFKRAFYQKQKEQPSSGRPPLAELIQLTHLLLAIPRGDIHFGQYSGQAFQTAAYHWFRVCAAPIAWGAQFHQFFTLMSDPTVPRFPPNSDPYPSRLIRAFYDGTEYYSALRTIFPIRHFLLTLECRRLEYSAIFKRYSAPLRHRSVAFHPGNIEEIPDHFRP
ncbi:hypothetical protein CVT25_008008 [Psilocybe cyanescens]|uniref:Uncharacterized protein n=1 Tax=Psilocybe cyanescens TaxID=93625 RepID=A0A409XMV0_PSICY|nr:hypothetical protein CVT25_008008 [Psilocybe cyanescens]